MCMKQKETMNRDLLRLYAITDRHCLKALSQMTAVKSVSMAEEVPAAGGEREASSQPFGAEAEALAMAVEQAILGGATMVQFREKERTGAQLEQDARAVQAICRKHGVPFIMNNDVALAQKLDADGVHVGQSDMPAAEARRLLGPAKIIGVTARTVAEAQAAKAAGADYLGSGAVFGTNTKRDAKTMPLETFRAITASVQIPVVAIGGISAANAGGLKSHGAAGLAVVSSLFGAADITEAARTLRAIADDIVADR